MLFIELLFNTIVTFKEQETIYPYISFQKSTQEKINITNYIKKKGLHNVVLTNIFSKYTKMASTIQRHLAYHH